MLIGVTPFYNRNRNMLLMKIKNSKVIFPDKNKYKIEYSDEIVDIINSVSNELLFLKESHNCSSVCTGVLSFINKNYNGS